MESQTVQLAHFIVATVVDFAIIQLDLQTTVSDVDCPSSDDLRLVRIAFAAFAAQGAAGQQDSCRRIITNRLSTLPIDRKSVGEKLETTRTELRNDQ
jgi:hypothetical protein